MAELDGTEAHHLLHVLRGKPGDVVQLFDGTGDEFVARIESTSKKRIVLSVSDRLTIDRELPHPLTLGVSLPKGERQKVVVEKAVELGVSELIPLRTERGVAVPTQNAVDRLRRSVIEASKQCGRNRLMNIRTDLQWKDWVDKDWHGATRLVANPGADQPLAISPGSPCVIGIGPEGGFTEEEISLARNAGWHIMNLGNSVLRIETAAIAAAAIVGHLMRQPR